MSFKRTLIRLLDRSVGRRVLAYLATRAACRATSADISIFYDKTWVHRVGDYFFPDGFQFNYYRKDFETWPTQLSKDMSNAIDWWLWKNTPSSGGVIVDIGAGRGEDALAFSQAVGPRGRVIAIEAHPHSFGLLQHFCRLNRTHNIVPMNVAILDHPGTVTITDMDDWESNSVMPGGPTGIQVPADTLEGICKQCSIQEIDLLKMNIEGAERYAISGIAPIMDRIKTICIACHDFRANRGEGDQFRTRSIVTDFLHKHGFEIYSRPFHSSEFVRDHLFGIRQH